MKKDRYLCRKGLCLLALVVMLSGCGQGASDSSTSMEAPSLQGEETLWSGEPSQEASSQSEAPASQNQSSAQEANSANPSDEIAEGPQASQEESGSASASAQEGINWTKVSQRMLELVNNLRAQEGAQLLTYDETLNQASARRVQEMISSQIFDHSRPDGSAFYTILQEYRFPYRAAGENLLWYETDRTMTEEEIAQKMFQLWENSDGHRRNMMDGAFNVLGFSGAQVGNRYYGLQIFAGTQD